MNEYEALREIIARATRYDRTYMAKVLIDLDPEGKGRVQIAIPDLGILTPAEGVWADVEMPIGVNVSPKAGDWVAVYFLGGDPSKPCVRGRTSIIKDNLPKNANRKQVFYEDDNTKIYYDEINSELSIDTKYKMTVKIAGDTDIEIKGTTTIKNSGDLSVQNDGNVDIKNGGDLSIQSDGATNIKSSGDIVIEGSGNVEIKGSKLTALSHLEVT